jgi:hypothetical protein
LLAAARILSPIPPTLFFLVGFRRAQARLALWGRMRWDLTRSVPLVLKTGCAQAHL